MPSGVEIYDRLSEDLVLRSVSIAAERPPNPDVQPSPLHCAGNFDCRTAGSETRRYVDLQDA